MRLPGEMTCRKRRVPTTELWVLQHWRGPQKRRSQPAKKPRRDSQRGRRKTKAV